MTTHYTASVHLAYSGKALRILAFTATKVCGGKKVSSCLQSTCALKRKASQCHDMNVWNRNFPVASETELSTTDNGMQRNKVILKQQVHGLQEQFIYEITSPTWTMGGQMAAATAQRGNIYLAGHYSGLHSYRAVERLYWLLLEKAYTVRLTLLRYCASVLPVLEHVWPQHKAYRRLIFLWKLKLSK